MLTRVLVLICCLLPLPSLQAATVRIAVLGIHGDDDARHRWAEVVRWLSTQLPEQHFLLVPHDLDSMERAVREGDVDLLLTNPGNYVELEARYGVSRLATLINHVGGQPHSRFGAVVFARHDRDDLQSLDDLRGRHFAAVAANAFGGFQMAAGALLERGIELQPGNGAVSFTGFPHQRVVERVLAGEADAGTVRTGVLETLALDGKLDLAAVKVLGARQVAGFDRLLSTRLYPEWAFARLRRTPQELAERVAMALFNMPNMQGQSWTAPLDYSPVRALLRRLQVGPYKETRRELLQRFLRVNAEPLGLAGLALAVLLVAMLLVFRANRRLQRSRRHLRLEVRERERAEAELQRHRESLEARVEQRTADLHHLNRALRRDIRQRQQVERALSRSSGLLTDLHDNFARIDANHSERIQGLLEISKHYFLCQAAALVRVDGRELLPVFEQHSRAGRWRRRIVEQVLAYSNGGLQRNSGHYADCFVRLLPVPVASGGEQHWILAFAGAPGNEALRGEHGIFAVITLLAGSELDRQRIELDLDQHRNRLAAVARLSALGQMATELAHELNQPLTAATNFATGSLRRLRYHPPLVNEVEQGLLHTVDALERAAAIIRSLRERVRGGDGPNERVDLCRVARSAARLASPQAAARQVALRSQLVDEPLWVSGCAIQLEQVVMNLLGNAIEASDTDGSGEVVVRCRADGERVLLTVADRGHGIAPRYEARVFEPFFSTKPQGMGVGLSICRTIVASCRGSIKVTSRAEGGALFVVQLPRLRRVDEGQSLMRLTPQEGKHD